MQTTIADIAPKAKVRVEEPMEVRRLKGDARMGEVLRRALDGRRRAARRRRQPAGPLRPGHPRARAGQRPRGVHRRPPRVRTRPAGWPCGPGWSARRAASSGPPARLGADEAWFEGELTASEEFSAAARHAVADRSPPPRSSATCCQLPCPARALRRRPPRPRTNGSCCSVRREATVSSTAWSVDDLALLDEAAFLTGGRTRTYGHIVVDEAQDLTPMQFRMIARRAPSGSITVLGDLAQATGPWTYADWDEVRATSRRRRHPITTSSPSGTGPRAACWTSPRGSCPSPPRASARPRPSAPAGPTRPSARCGAAELGAAALDEARRLAEEHALVAVIAPEDLVADARPAGSARRTTSGSSSATP